MEDKSRPTSYESKMDRLQVVVERLERATLSLDESLALFEEGMSLSRLCDQQLADVEARVKVLVESPQDLNPRKDVEFEQIQIQAEDGE